MGRFRAPSESICDTGAYSRSRALRSFVGNTGECEKTGRSKKKRKEVILYDAAADTAFSDSSAGKQFHRSG